MSEECASRQNQMKIKEYGDTWRRPCIMAGIAMLILAALCAGCAGRSAYIQEYNRENIAMDTLISIRVWAADPELASKAFDAAFAEFNRIASLTDRFAVKNLPDPEISDVYRINKYAGIRPVTVSEDTLTMLEKSRYFAELSDGAFDVTVGPLLDLWGFGQEKYHVPSDQELDSKLALVGYEQVLVNRADKSVFLPKKGMEIDLGGIAKGYAADMAAQKLRQMGIKSALINAGGNIYALGSQPDGSPWLAGIQDPRNNNKIIAVLKIKDMAVVTSGDYNRYFIQDGIRYHHILDPSTGKPARQVISATIVAPSATDADVLSTTLFVMGSGPGTEFGKNMGNVQAVFIDEMSNITYSEELNDRMDLVGDGAYGTAIEHLK